VWSQWIKAVLRGSICIIRENFDHEFKKQRRKETARHDPHEADAYDVRSATSLAAS
jgi:hypothetical protein